VAAFGGFVAAAILAAVTGVLFWKINGAPSVACMAIQFSLINTSAVITSVGLPGHEARERQQRSRR